MGLLFVNAFVLDYSKNFKARSLCRIHSRLIAISFLLNTLVCINEIGCCFIFAKKFVYLKVERVLKLNRYYSFSSQVTLFYLLIVMDF